jgi:hypothetical protein
MWGTWVDEQLRTRLTDYFYFYFYPRPLSHRLSSPRQPTPAKPVLGPGFREQG